MVCGSIDIDDQEVIAKVEVVEFHAAIRRSGSGRETGHCGWYGGLRGGKGQQKVCKNPRTDFVAGQLYEFRIEKRPGFRFRDQFPDKGSFPFAHSLSFRFVSLRFILCWSVLIFS